MKSSVTLEDIKRFKVSGDEDGFCGCIRDLLTDPGMSQAQPLNLKFHPNFITETMSEPKDLLIESESPTSDYSVVFVHERGGRADFYAIKRGKKSPVLDSMLIYRITKPWGSYALEILWSEDGLKSALLMNGKFHAVYDFEALTGFCRTTGCQVMNYGFKTCRKWADHAMNSFISDPKDHFPIVSRPTAADLRDHFLKEYLKPTLKTHGYKGNRLDFFKELKDVFTMVSFQNSAYSTQCERRFSLHLGVIKKTEMTDQDPKKLSFHSVGRNSHYGVDNFLSKERKENPYRDGQYYLIKRDDSITDFVKEFRTDFEDFILPTLERLPKS